MPPALAMPGPGVCLTLIQEQPPKGILGSSIGVQTTCHQSPKP